MKRSSNSDGDIIDGRYAEPQLWSSALAETLKVPACLIPRYYSQYVNLSHPPSWVAKKLTN
jgi:hypothetical protein